MIKTGEWLQVDDDSPSFSWQKIKFVCSNCGGSPKSIAKRVDKVHCYAFCPYCGAMMTEGQGDAK